jgi:hypothetical protein
MVNTEIVPKLMNGGAVAGTAKGGALDVEDIEPEEIEKEDLPF